jgi:hypothetical protein
VFAERTEIWDKLQVEEHAVLHRHRLIAGGVKQECGRRLRGQPFTAKRG